MSDIAPGAASRRTTGTGGLKLYKPGQGYYTRLGTAIGGGVLVVSGGVFLFRELGGMLNQDAAYFLPVQYGVAVGFMALMGAVIYWIVGRHHRANDFFIATEGEMKKVSWSSRREVIRSTKVVIVTVILMAIFLFIADILFMVFMNQIGVLKGGVGLLDLLGIS